MIKTTRGMHFYFKNDERIQSNKTDTKLFLGINSDIKIGSRNSGTLIFFIFPLSIKLCSLVKDNFS